MAIWKLDANCPVVIPAPHRDLECYWDDRGEKSIAPSCDHKVVRLGMTSGVSRPMDTSILVDRARQVS